MTLPSPELADLRQTTLLIVDDDVAVREALADALGDESTEIRRAGTAEDALAVIGKGDVDAVLADVRMPGLGGIELLQILRKREIDVDVILMTAFDDMDTVVAGMREGAVEFLVKPLELHALRRILAGVVSDRRARAGRRLQDRTSTSAPEGFPGALLGRHTKMVHVFKLIGQAARTKATVLIRGETGTGKELIARAIHANSADADAPFIAVNCAALPPTLLESELFGHVRGAFTGAMGDRKGRFALAGRGTIFLDEIGDTSTELQAKLLRVLQEREYYPVGAERAYRTEARVIAATHQDLEALVARGQFRADLYYRLRIVEVCVPALRDRSSDIPLLAKHFVLRGSRAAGRHPAVLSDDALARLMQHDWPGNVRELENCIVRALILASGDVVRSDHVQLNLPSMGGQENPGNATLEALERTHVARVFAALGGHKARTAKTLGISRPRLDRLLRKYGLG